MKCSPKVVKQKKYIDKLFLISILSHVWNQIKIKLRLKIPNIFFYWITKILALESPSYPIQTQIQNIPILILYPPFNLLFFQTKNTNIPAWIPINYSFVIQMFFSKIKNSGGTKTTKRKIYNEQLMEGYIHTHKILYSFSGVS